MTRYITSSVWGGTSVPVNTEHGEDVRSWNADCSWYQYGLDLGLNGCQHPGMDIGVSYVPIYAARAGTVIKIGSPADCPDQHYYTPYNVQIEAANGDIDIYGHFSAVASGLSVDDTVTAGQRLGTSGEQTFRCTTTPDGSGAHLHFEVRRHYGDGYRVINPEPILLGSAGPVVTTPPSFSRGDKLNVADGPVNIRATASTSGTLVTTANTGDKLCVVDGSTRADGYTWYKVNIAGSATSGWVAGEFCELESAGGCITFAGNDKIKVVEDAVNLRTAPSLDSSIVSSLAVNTQLCISKGPTSADGHNWYKVTVSGGSTTGWVSARYCALVTAAGCSASGPTPVPTSSINPGDLLTVTDGPLNLRATAGTAGSVLVALPAGTRGVVVGGPTNSGGYTWRQIDTRIGSTTYRGWAASEFMAKLSSFTNRIANSTAKTNLSNIDAANASSTVTRVVSGADYAVKCVDAGTVLMEGVSYSSGPLNLTGQRFFSGVIDSYGAGEIDVMRVRIYYTDGTVQASAVAPTFTPSGTAWKRIVAPIVASDPAKTISELRLWARRNSIAAQTFYTDNAKIIEL